MHIGANTEDPVSIDKVSQNGTSQSWYQNGKFSYK